MRVESWGPLDQLKLGVQNHHEVVFQHLALWAKQKRTANRGVLARRLLIAFAFSRGQPDGSGLVDHADCSDVSPNQD